MKQKTIPFLLLFVLYVLCVPVYCAISTPFNETYHVSGSISYLDLDDNLETVRKNESYDIISDSFPLQGLAACDSIVFSRSHANLFSVSVNNFAGVLYDPYEGSSICLSQAISSWSFQPISEDINLIFKHTGQDDYYPAHFTIILIDEQTDQKLIDFENIMTPWTSVQESFHRTLDLTHIYRLEMAIDADARDSAAGGVLELVSIPEPTTFIFLTCGFMILRHRKS